MATQNTSYDKMSDVPVHFETLNTEQSTAVKHPSGPAMVLAGAGSGKTTVLTSRVAWLLHEQHIAPEAIMVVTFTNKAATELRQRILVTTGQTLALSGTFHSLCARILRRDGKHIGLIPDFVIYDTDDQESLLKDIYKTNNIDPKEHPLKLASSVISNAKNQMLSPSDYAESARGDKQAVLARIYKLYQHALHKAQAVDFDDLLLRTLELFAVSEKTLQKYQSSLEHILVDEYQDTNTVQYQLTKLLAKPQNNLYVVGDFSQSIYSWRGADYRNMLSLKTDFPNLVEYKLERNYRSKQVILDAATQVISHNTSHPILELWTEQTGGELIAAYEAENPGDEARQVSKYIRKLRHEFEYEDMVVLYRTNAQSRAFEEAFIRGGIPYRLVGGTKFYERKEVKDVLSYVRYLINRADTVSYQRLVKLGKRSFSSFEQWAGSPDSQNILSEPPAVMIREILEKTSYLDKYSKQTEENLQRMENVYELVNVAAQFKTVTQFLENVALIQNDTFVDGHNKTDQMQHAVTLMSIHAAKGLEFAVVFVVGMEEGIFPHSRSFLERDQMEEERRLCYVAITRAKERLFFSYARSRYQYGMSTNSLRSRFLSDIDDSLLQYENDSFSRSSNTSSSSRTSQSGRRYVPVDEEMVAGVLSGEFDIDAFIDS